MSICSAALAFGSAGCSHGDVSDLFGFKRMRLVDELVITTDDGQSFRGSAATLELVAPLPNGPAARATVSISTVDPYGYGLSLSSDLPPSALLDSTLTIDFFDGPGTGTLALLTSSGAEIISPGTASLTMHRGVVDGFVKTEHPILPSAKIEGTYEIHCLVSPEMIGVQTNGQPSDGTWIVVEDLDKRSTFCRTFTGL